MSNLPANLVASLADIKGFNKQAFEQVHVFGQQVTSIRVNPAKAVGTLSPTVAVSDEMPILAAEATNGQLEDANTDVGNTPIAYRGEPVPWCPHGCYLPQRPSFTFDPLFHAGTYYVQEASSMFLWEVLRQTVGSQTDGLKVLDLCAAPGGKSTLLASYFSDGLVVANEVIRNRAAVLAENITKWGCANTVVTNSDPKNFAALGGYFDVMVVDAPCSGSGLFRKDADAIAEWSEGNVLLCSQRQQRILADAYGALKNNGVLIYSTCSYSKEEDEDITAWVCEELGAETVRLRIDAAWGIVEVGDDGSKAYGYRFYPYLLQGEGFFIAAFVKRGGVEAQHRVQVLQKTTKEETAAIEPFVNSREELFYFRQAENIIAVPARWKNDVAILQKHLYLRKAGVTLGELKGRDMVPNHELAVSLLNSSNVAQIPLSLQQAIQYLQKKDVELSNLPRGWALATYEGINLGWVKVLPNRINNYYPVEWRILKNTQPISLALRHKSNIFNWL